MSKVLMKGNEALAEAALRAGCRYFFGYPITPQNELPEYMARKLPELGGVFLQAESEIGAINMVFGASGAGARVMTSSSSPGISLKMEGISYIAGAELPCVIVNVVRGGPGLGNIQAAQSDYFQATRGGGHGDYRLLVYAPSSIQEAIDLTLDAFDKADYYRNPAMILADGILGQMMEPVEFPQKYQPKLIEKPWATTGMEGRSPNLISSLHIVPENLARHNQKMQEKYGTMAEKEIRWEEYYTKDARYLLVAYGTTARVGKAAVDRARENGFALGLFRPVTLWPFPYEALKNAAAGTKLVSAVEMSEGQLVEDVRLAMEGACPVRHIGQGGGVLPSPADIIRAVKKFAGEVG